MQTLSTTHADILADIFARNRALYGGFVMELDESTEEESTEEQPDESTAESTEEAKEESTEKTDEPDGEDADKTLSHEDALKALTKVRGENASWRTKHRDLETKLEGAKSPEEVAEIIAESKRVSAEAEHALVVENVALKFKLPDDLAAALKGSTREELEAHAKVLAKYAPVENDPDPDDLGGGLDPDNGGDTFDAKAELRKIRGRRR